ncbi:MAG: hypothetical protein M1832_000979 [Thelocarpon impressellum]|nr:MAG: hypothetical protein M1832_000979 [Thelocarpon impressellum]
MLQAVLQTGLRRSLRPAVGNAQYAGTLIISRGMAEGATGSGASRAGGVASGDAYTKREKANEDFYVKEKEREKLLGLRKKLEQQRAHLAELDKHIEELTKDQGGEHN